MTAVGCITKRRLAVLLLTAGMNELTFFKLKGSPQHHTLQSARRFGRFALLKFLLLLPLFSAGAAHATLWYVDNTATGANNGTSWANAWKAISSIKGVAAGDTVYISGGPSGSSQTYTTGTWAPTGGTSTSPITYQIGQDSLHNGTAIFYASSSGLDWISSSLANVVISGDAGDGQMHFSASNFADIGSGTDDSYVRIAYVNFGQIGTDGNGGCFDLYLDGNGKSASHVEFDHNYVYVIGSQADHFSYALFVASTWDVNKAHNNTIYVPHTPGDARMGADCFQWNGDGYSIYSNTIVGYNSSSYSGGQHQDGWQPTGGGSGTAAAGSSYSSDAIYLKYYANTIVNCGNSACFACVTYGGFNHMWIYNNIVIYDGTTISGSPEGLTAVNNQAGTADYLDTVVANNLIVDLNDAVTSEWAIWVGDYTSVNGNANVSGVVANNVTVNASTINYGWTSGSFTTGDNVQFTSASAVGNFVKYVLNNGLNNNFNLTSASSLRGAGMNLSSYFTTDFAGNQRPATGAWDIGPYAYGATVGSSGPSLTLSAITQSASDVDPTTAGTQVYEGTTVQYSATATENSTNTVSWQWSYQTNGSPQINYLNGAGTVTPVSFIYPAGSGGTTYVWTLTVNDGKTNLTAQATTGVEPPPTPQTGLTFQATNAATVTSPFVLANGYLSQPVQTTVISSAGEATFNFSITNTGNYVIQAMVNAPSDPANSFYVNIDAQPVDPTMCWDIFPFTTNFQQRIVSWRGNGSDTNNQFVPKIFPLAVGTHQIIWAGREANTELQSFSILQLPNAPQNLRVLPTPPANSPVFPTAGL